MDPKTGKVKRDDKGELIIARKKKVVDVGSETDYSEDTDGEVKLDRHGNPVPRYELDAHSGKPKRDNKGRPIVKRKRKTIFVPSGSETDYSVDSQGDVKLDRSGKPVPRYVKDSRGNLKKDSKGRPIVMKKQKRLVNDS